MSKNVDKGSLTLVVPSNKNGCQAILVSEPKVFEFEGFGEFCKNAIGVKEEGVVVRGGG